MGEHILIKSKIKWSDGSNESIMEMKIFINDYKLSYLELEKKSNSYEDLIERTKIFIFLISSNFFGTGDNQDIEDEKILFEINEFFNIVDPEEYKEYEKNYNKNYAKWSQETEALYEEDAEQRDYYGSDDDTESFECACGENPCICSDPDPG